MLRGFYRCKNVLINPKKDQTVRVFFMDTKVNVTIIKMKTLQFKVLTFSFQCCQRWGDIQWWWWCWFVWMVSNQSVACHPHFSLSVTASCLGHDPLVSSLIWSPWLIITLTLTMLSKIFVIRVHFMFCTVIKRRWRAGKRFAAKSYFPNPEPITVQ